MSMIIAASLAYVSAYIMKDELSYLISLEYTFNSIKNSEINKWYNEIIIPNDKNILGKLFLGALPIIKPINISDLMINESNINSVLSIVQQFELELGTTMLGFVGNKIVPVSPSYWEEHEIKHKVINSHDFQAVPQEVIEEGVEYIHNERKNGRNICVHCKAGRGRSVIVVACYLVKYYGMTTDEAIDFIKQRRPQINLNKDQIEAIVIFELGC